MSKAGQKHERSRPPLARMLKIHQAIQGGGFPTARKLAEELEVCAKSIYRDIEFMRDRLNLPVAFHPANQGYYYTQDVSTFPTLQITEGELFALLVAEKALQQYRGTNFEKPLLSAIQKMQESLPETISMDLSEVGRAISFRTRAEPILNLEIFRLLADATSMRQQLELTYKKPGHNAPEKRVVDPYHLANINGEWFLFAYDHLRQDIRTFVPARIHEVNRTGKTFTRRQGFSLEKRLRDSFGVRSGEGKYDVVIKFALEVADYVREKKWHDSQQLIEKKSGEIELRMKLSSLAEVERWVLSWGGNAVVVKPPELAASVGAAAKRILRAGAR